ncbi:protein PAIR1 [Oryza brachyantha]|uniref:protein PAIR1 n=1 Tax=Oryza brachyantha TaxID=4533 RepID=UPI001ADD59FA|nr:protein PAIR1 [Oryza brachyantha]
MKLKMNKACDIASISVLPPRRTGGSGMSAAASAAVASQPRSQPLSFSQQGVGSGGASLLHSHSQSQLSQASIDDNLLGLHLLSPARDQRFGVHEDSSKRMPSLPASSGSCVREESQLQLAKVPSNSMHRWNPSVADTRCQVANEDVERKFQHLASSLHKMGMVVDSVQSDVMQLNRSMKEASLDSSSIRQKVVLLESSLQQILKGQEDLKSLFESSIKGNPDQTSVLNSHARKLDEISSTLSTLQTLMQANIRASKLDEISSTLSTLQTQMQADIRQLQGDIFRVFTKEMEGIVRAIRSLNGRPAAIQMMADQSHNANERLLRSQIPVENRKSPMNQIANARSCVNQTPILNGRPLVSQIPVVNRRPEMNQLNRWIQMNQTPVAAGRSPMNQAPAADGNPRINQKPITKEHPAHLVYPAKVTDQKPKVEQGKVKAAPQKPFASSYYRVAPKQEEVAIIKVTPHVPAKKAPVSIIIDSDDDSEGRASCVILKTETGSKEWKVTKQGTEEGLEILRKARKRRRREMQSIVLAS